MLTALPQTSSLDSKGPISSGRETAKEKGRDRKKGKTKEREREGKIKEKEKAGRAGREERGIRGKEGGHDGHTSWGKVASWCLGGWTPLSRILMMRY